MKHKLFFLTIFIFILACNKTDNQMKKEQWKSEIIAIEKAFNDMAQKEGLSKAFEFYAAENGVIQRGEKIIKGKNKIGQFYENADNPNTLLTWSPDFVDISQSGDMAYTYGEYTFSYLDSLGMRQESKGIFHTVWKRQQDGTWRFVYD